MELLAWISLFLAVLLGSSAQTVDLSSPRVTNWGTWYGWEECPEGTYAAGAQIRAMMHLPGLDQYGLTGVRFWCLPINWSEYVTWDSLPQDRMINSGVAEYGGWQAIKWCPLGQVIVGFQLRSLGDQGRGDDVAADNFAAYCGSPFSAPDHNNWISGDTAGWGDWTAKQFCPLSFAVCGINTQIDPAHGKGYDDTGLNNVDLQCCKVDYSCTPDAELVTVDSFDNTNGAGDMVYEYTVHTSFTKMSSTSETMSIHEKTMIGNKISAELGVAVSFLSAKLTAEMSSTLENGSTKSLQNLVQDTSQHSITKKIVVNIPKGTKSVIKQLHFTCGGYRMAVAQTLNLSE